VYKELKGYCINVKEDTSCFDLIGWFAGLKFVFNIFCIERQLFISFPTNFVINVHSILPSLYNGLRSSEQKLIRLAHVVLKHSSNVHVLDVMDVKWTSLVTTGYQRDTPFKIETPKRDNQILYNYFKSRDIEATDL